MYSHFIQFTIPRIGQCLVAFLLFLNFLTLPIVQIFSGQPLFYYGVPLVLALLIVFIQLDPLDLGMVWTSFLLGFYLLCDAVSLVAHLVGGRFATLWQAVYGGGVLAWVLAALLMLYGWWRAHRLCATHYALTTEKPLPNGRLRIVQLSDIHPGSTMTKKRIPELQQIIDEFNPDLLALTGDIFDENTARDEFEAFCEFFGKLNPPLGKWFVLGNHDLGEHWHSAQYTRADLETAFAAAGVRVLEDVAVNTPAPCPVRIVGRKDWLYTEHKRFTPAELLPDGPDGRYTILLDHEPRELKADAAAGADLILCGHTHGGQIWPLGLVSKLFRYNEQNYGCRRIQCSGTPGCHCIVSGGTGTWSYQLRTEGRTEVVCIEITSAKS